MIEPIVENIRKSRVVWLPLKNSKKMIDCQSILNSWKSQEFKFIEENVEFEKAGLRIPQIGALYSLLGYLKSDNNKPATIVMPTGTGKTEVILSSIIAGKFEKTLIIVPSDALREQTSDKLIKSGLLRELGLITEEFLNPIVAIIKHGLLEEDTSSILKSNVIIATASALSKVSSTVLESFSQNCSHLII
ncbi:DEAD/DEAH box helicase family protein [Moraxella osloensis]|uniref:DEAD/DEAH box helicase family protein n=1 Tax=Faucicola osloensis TaxID=34062 RepID=UPI002004EF01|nr:DEAD/DEAH box helicase family protein [Moraxella osloensis]MCK6053656.1 DEAD/DEAH box helicase family protein [Moraxella osloensis]